VTGQGLHVRGVSKSFGPLEALAPLDLDVEPGELVTLLGPSGCGKTTLLRIVAGLESATTGVVTVGGGTPSAARSTKQIGFVPQSPALLPWRTVEANAGLLPDVNRGANPGPMPDVSSLLEQVGLAEFRDASPRELSGGMQQRVALVRAFALGAPFLLMDEPFAALDEITRSDMRHLLAELCEPMAVGVLFVTHSLAEAVFLSDRIVVMSASPGRIIADISVVLPRPREQSLLTAPEFMELKRQCLELIRQVTLNAFQQQNKAG